MKDDKEHVIAYGSKCLTKAERRYCVTRCQLFAIVYFVKHFKQYLYGVKFLVRTDHGSFSTLRHQRARWPGGSKHFQPTNLKSNTVLVGSQ